MGIFTPIIDDTLIDILMCILGGTFNYDTYSASAKFNTKLIALEGGKFSAGTTPCTKQIVTSGALPNCGSSLPALTFSIFPKVEGSKCVVDFSIQMMAENMIPEFIYVKGKAPTVTVN